MDRRSSARSKFVDNDIGVNSSMEESDLTEFDVGVEPKRENALTEFEGVFPNSPTREKFLSDIGSVPDSHMRSADVNWLSMRESVEGDSDGTSKSPVCKRNATQLPFRGTKTQMSERSRYVIRSPMRDGRVAARRRVFVSEFDKFAEAEQEDIRVINCDEHGKSEYRKLTLKSSFNVLVADSELMGQSNDNSLDRRTWRNQIGFGVNPRKNSLYRDNGGQDIDGFLTPKAITDRSDAHGRISASSCNPGNQASNGCLNTISSCGEPRYSVESLRGPGCVRDLKVERAELLQRHEELSKKPSDLENMRISSSELSERIDDSEDEVERFQTRSGQQFTPLRGVRRPIYVSHSPSPVSNNMTHVYGIHPHVYDYQSSGQMTRVPHPRRAHHFPKHTPGSIGGKDDQEFLDHPSSGQMTWGAHRRQANQFSKYTPGSVGWRYDQIFVVSYFNEMHYHHPSCVCSFCRTQGQDLSYPLAGRRPANSVGSSWPSHDMNRRKYDPRAYNTRMVHTSPLKQPSNLASHHPRRHHLANKQLSLPIGCCAPFILCHNCLQLLKLPWKLIAKRNKYKVQCGACSTLMSYYFQGKSLRFLSAQNKDFIGADSGLVKSFKELSPRLHCFHSMDSEPIELSKDHSLSASMPYNERQISQSSSVSSKEDQISDNPSLRSKLPHVEAGEMTYCTEEKEKEKEIEKDVPVESSSENTTVAVNMDVHFQEVGETSFSQQSEDFPEQEHKSEKNKARQSSMMKSMASGSTEVYVNGHHIPHHLVKKAEK